MGKRTLRAIHFELVAAVLKLRLDYVQTIRELPLDTGSIQDFRDDYVGGRQMQLVQLVMDFADEFEIRSETFSRGKFLKSCGLEE